MSAQSPNVEHDKLPSDKCCHMTAVDKGNPLVSVDLSFRGAFKMSMSAEQ